MSTLPLILPLLLSGGLAAGYVTVVIGIRREDKAMSLGAPPDGRTASLARRVTDCHIRREVRTSKISWTQTALTRPRRGVPTSPVRRCVPR